MYSWSPWVSQVRTLEALRRLDLDNGLIRPLTVAPNPLGGAWNRDGTIVFAPNYTGPIFRTAATGGDAQPLTRMEAGQSSHGFPLFLPDGRRFLYFVTGTGQIPGVYVGDLEAPLKQRLRLPASDVRYAAPGYLLFVDDRTLFAQAFDASRLELSGEPVAIVPGLDTNVAYGSSAFTVSQTGVLAYHEPGSVPPVHTVWLNRFGKQRTSCGACKCCCRPFGERGARDCRCGGGFRQHPADGRHSCGADAPVQ